MDIRRYFQAPKQSGNNLGGGGGNDGVRKTKKTSVSQVGNVTKVNLTKPSRRSAVIESDDDEEGSQVVRKLRRTDSRSRYVIEDSDDDDKRATKVVSQALSVNARDYFGSAPVVQHHKKSSVDAVPDASRGKTKPSDKFKVHDDEDFVETLRSLDSVVDQDPSKKGLCQEAEVSSLVRPCPSKDVGRKRTPSKGGTVPGTPAEAERRKSNYAHYMRYVNREGPSAPGSKPVPQGQPGCLSGLSFVVTGVLDSLERDEANDLVTRYGGKVQKSVCRSTTYAVLGRDAGPSKLKKIDEYKTKVISEDELLDLIRTRPGTSSALPSSRASNGSASQVPPRASPEVPQKLAGSGDPVASKVDCDLMWVDKFRPTTTKQIIGQQGDRSPMNKLRSWLARWFTNNGGGSKRNKPVRGRFGAAADDGSGFKAALLSGPPGVGKTTTAQLVCHELGFAYVERNASDTRSKRSLQDVVRALLTNKSIDHYAAGKAGEAQMHCLLMDEVDGMAGNEDRGGIQELIQLIRSSRIPIICLCNDRNHPKIRSLANYCYDLRFQKPRVEQLKGAFMSICFKEGVEISSDALQEIVVAANQDVRQILHHLCVWSIGTRKLSVEEATRDASRAKKDLRMGPFDVLKSVFSASDHKRMGIQDKSDLFFHDYSLAPLFVHENYLAVVPHRAADDPLKRLRLVSEAADSISSGDLVDKLIRSESQWGLLPVQAMFASVIPGDLLEGHLNQMIAFPSWLGRNSSRAKVDRILQELHLHTRLRTSGSKVDLNLDYARHLVDAVVRPLTLAGQEGVGEAVDVMSHYCLLREDLDALLEVSAWPGQPNLFARLTPQVKAAFTKAYNKVAHLNPYSSSSSVSASSRRKTTAEDEGYELEEDAEEQEEQETEDVTKDSMIRVQAKRRRKPESSEATSRKKTKVTRKGK